MTELILIGGGSCSGKTTAAQVLKEYLGEPAVLLSMDNFYKGIGVGYETDRAVYNFDHPAAVDFDTLFRSLNSLMTGKITQIPVYDFTTHSRVEGQLEIRPGRFLILEGIFALYCREIVEMSRLRFFVDCGVDAMIRRRIERDVKDRGRTVKQVVEQFLDTVLPMYYEFVEPTKKAAGKVVDGRQAAEEILAEMTAYLHTYDDCRGVLNTPDD